jgi:hypothetical protein
MPKEEEDKQEEEAKDQGKVKDIYWKEQSLITIPFDLKQKYPDEDEQQDMADQLIFDNRFPQLGGRRRP